MPHCWIISYVLIIWMQQSEPQPDIEEHELKVAGINEEIKKIKDQIEVLRAKIDEANEARRGQGVRSRFFVFIFFNIPSCALVCVFVCVIVSGRSWWDRQFCLSVAIISCRCIYIYICFAS